MRTKEGLLALLEESKGAFISGEEIARALSISRTSVWKAINQLRGDGYEINGAPNKGYCLSTRTDILSAQGIRKYLANSCLGMDLHVYAQTDSTNNQLRERAAQGATEGCVIVAGSQTAGRGRRGRSFYSPQNTGVYFSVLLQPEGISPDRAVQFTTMAAVAVCEAIESVSGQPAGIKWVNDIYMRGKKVCGILTEASLSMETESIDYVILGIGINIYPPESGFPKDLQEIAGSVFENQHSDGKNRLVAEVLNRFMFDYTHSNTTDYQTRYRKKSLSIGKTVQVLSKNGPRPALVLDVDCDCRLLVQYEDGTTEALSSGEISIKLPRNDEEEAR